jgi:cytochrome b
MRATRIALFRSHADLTTMTRIQVWDWPVRLVHWLLVALLGFSWWSAENHEMEYHRYSGYAVLGVLIFRVYWGFVGSATARFTNFIKRPSAIVAYLRGGQKVVGHNPLGALSVIALLSLIAAQVGLGLFAVDIDGLESGPLSYLVSFETGRVCAEIHEIVFKVLMVMVIVHIIAIVLYLLFKRDNLIGPMITGSRLHSATDATLSDSTATISAPWLKVIIGIALAGAVTWVIA